MKVELVARYKNNLPGTILEVSGELARKLTAHNLARAYEAPPVDKQVKSANTKAPGRQADDKKQTTRT